MSSSTYAFETFVLDPAHRRLALRSGEAVPITPKAFDALVYLVERSGRLVERRELISALWPGRFVEDNNVSQVVLALRRALGDTGPTPIFIATVPRRGYQFIANVVSPPAVVTPQLNEYTPASTQLPGLVHARASARPRMAPRQTLAFAAFAVCLATLAITSLLRGAEAPLISGNPPDSRSQIPGRLAESGTPPHPKAFAACRDTWRNKDACATWRELESAFLRQRQLGLQST